jgi:thioredoxin 1
MKKINQILWCGVLLVTAVACERKELLPPAEIELSSKDKNQHVLTVTDENFQSEVLGSELPVLVDFWAPWCGPCVKQGPIVEALAEELTGMVKFGKANVDETPKLASQFRVRSIPTLIVFQKGEPVKELVGLQNRNELAAVLKEFTAK